MNTKISTKIQQHLEHNWRFWLGTVYFTVLILVSVAVVRKQAPKPEPLPAPVVVAPAPTINLEPLQQRIENLERELESQAVTKKQLDIANDNLEKANQRLERRLQAHTEAFKRICEYIMVITIDKKLVPRQCLPEYKWSREEGA